MSGESYTSTFNKSVGLTAFVKSTESRKIGIDFKTYHTVVWLYDSKK